MLPKPAKSSGISSTLSQNTASLLILGCGFTGRRVALQGLALGWQVYCTNCSLAIIPGLTSIALDVADRSFLAILRKIVPPGAFVLHSIPPQDKTDHIAQTLEQIQPERVVYLSTTGVYGLATAIDEQTPAAPATERARLRLATEDILAAGPWSSLILRPAAIYGPGRGIHARIAEGSFQMPSDNRVISRIHVDDLATHVIASLSSNLTGRFPVADEEPCPSLDVARFTAALLNLPFSAIEPPAQPGHQVDGSAIRRHLQLSLRFPSYRQGVPASLLPHSPAAKSRG